MSDDVLSITLDEPLATKVRAAAEACGLSPEEWVEMAMRRRMEIDRLNSAARSSEPASKDIEP